MSQKNKIKLKVTHWLKDLCFHVKPQAKFLVTAQFKTISSF